MAPLLEQCPILYRNELRPGVVDLVLRAASIAPLCSPGQFVHIKCSDELLLRRPISLCDVEDDTIRLVIESVGKGSKWLCERQAGELLDLLGPLGDHGFPIPDADDGRPILLIGGGVGAPPMLGLCRALVEKGLSPRVILGFNSAREAILLDGFRALGADVTVTTADGSMGARGFVTAAMDLPHDYFFACGPEPMLRAVAQKSPAPGQLSFEERMGCGFGVCMGCSCQTKYGAKRICKDGPVLLKEEIIW